MKARSLEEDFERNITILAKWACLNTGATGLGVMKIIIFVKASMFIIAMYSVCLLKA